MFCDVAKPLHRPVTCLALWSVLAFSSASLSPSEKPLSRSVSKGSAKALRILLLIYFFNPFLQGDYNLAVNDYKKVKAIFSSSDVGAFERGGFVPRLPFEIVGQDLIPFPSLSLP